ncbi:MAG: BrnT family toxin [Desulfamplus sp.]|nr:BrnT family toxin [Desulfamplus sp.]
MSFYRWNTDKNLWLKKERGISFEEIVWHIEHGYLLDDLAHPNQEKYPEQRIMIIKVKDYAFIVPYVENEDGVFLKTVIPNRKATREYITERIKNDI